MVGASLKLTEGAFHTGQGVSIFGSIGDSAPDRWGRILMRRAEANRAKDQNRLPSTLFEIDYLLGVNDEARQGALRFSLPEEENLFLAPRQKTIIPPLVDLPKLLSATERFIEETVARALNFFPNTKIYILKIFLRNFSNFLIISASFFRNYYVFIGNLAYFYLNLGHFAFNLHYIQLNQFNFIHSFQQIMANRLKKELRLYLY